MTSVPPDEDLLKKELAEAARQKFDYLSCRLWAGEIDAVQRLQRNGFYLTDLGITWERETLQSDVVSIGVREAGPTDAGSVSEMASDLFIDARFYHDPFFSRAEANNLYQTWTENLLRGSADKVFFVANKGFIACKVSGSVGEIVLVGVAPAYQGQGVGTTLVQAAIGWMRSAGAGLVTVRTQAGNTNANRFYGKQGFRMKTADVTMAKVFSSGCHKQEAG